VDFIMPETTNCGELRNAWKSFSAASEFPDAILQHLAACDECMDAYLQAGLREHAPAEMPQGFADRLLGRLRTQEHLARGARWRFPYFTVAACVLSFLLFVPSGWEELLMLGQTMQLFASFRVSSFSMGGGNALLPVLFTVGAIEIGASIVFMWRLSRA
jgi:hypothetical protein